MEAGERGCKSLEVKGREVKGRGGLEKGLASVETELGLKVGGWKKARDQLRSLVNRGNS